MLGIQVNTAESDIGDSEAADYEETKSNTTEQAGKKIICTISCTNINKTRCWTPCPIKVHVGVTRTFVLLCRKSLCVRLRGLLPPTHEQCVCRPNPRLDHND